MKTVSPLLTTCGDVVVVALPDGATVVAPGEAATVVALLDGAVVVALAEPVPAAAWAA